MYVRTYSFSTLPYEHSWDNHIKQVRLFKTIAAGVYHT